MEEIEERQKKIPHITQQMKEEYDAIPQEEIERKNDKLAEQLSFAIFNQIVWDLFLFILIINDTLFCYRIK